MNILIFLSPILYLNGIIDAYEEVIANSVILEAQSLAAGRARRMGIVVFSKDYETGEIVLSGNITVQSGGEHGFHIHALGDISNGCASAMGHYNPDGVDHAAPTSAVRHVGDLGNVRANSQGLININIRDRGIQLSGPRSIVGRAVVLHEDRDDLGLGSFPDSKTTGHAGARLGCGVIGRVSLSASSALLPSALLPALLTLVASQH